MRYLSVCSGIEAASVAWAPLGWECVGVAEIEKFPSAVLAHHYPNVPNFGDLTRFQEWPDDLAPDLIVGGTPCQSFSVAGLRAGLADPRGNLALVFLALVDKYRPRFVVWENVPGVRSSGGGRDFGAFLGALGELGYGWAYRSLDAQYFGLAQRRERVFVVGCLGDGVAPAEILFEPESVCRDTPPRRQAREAAARDAGEGAGVGCEFGPSGGRLTDLNPTLDARAKDGPIRNQLAGAALMPKVWPVEIAPTLNAAFADKQGLEDQHALSGAGLFVPMDPSALVIDKRTAAVTEHVSPTLKTDLAHDMGPVIAFKPGQSEAAGALFITEEVAPTLQGSGNGSTMTPAVAYAADLAPTLPASGAGTSRTGNERTEAELVVAFDTYNLAVSKDGTSQTLSSSATDVNHIGAVVGPQVAVRRLTPRECERLQGFPDDYTLIPYRNGMSADGPRYKALGNSMAVPVMAFIGRRIAEVDAMAVDLERRAAA